MTDYLTSNGLSYSTVWTIGCPNRCAYCGNSKFIANDPQYRKIRHSDARYIVDEVKQVLRKHHHIKTVIFNDDNFMSIKSETIREFAELWHEEIKIPFTVLGVYPSNLKAEKLAILTWAGMNRVRMGIQSGSERILNFYKRPTSVEKIMESAMKIARFSKYHVPPGYDVIVDNPIETQQDVIDTLELVYKLPRPFFLYIYSLRIIPNTELEREIKEYGATLNNIDTNYFIINPTSSNILLYLLTFYKPPRWIFDKLLKNVHPSHASQKKYYALGLSIRLIHGIKRGFDYLRFMDFSTILGKSGYYLWRLGLIDFWHKHINAKMPKPNLEKQGATSSNGDLE